MSLFLSQVRARAVGSLGSSGDESMVAWRPVVRATHRAATRARVDVREGAPQSRHSAEGRVSFEPRKAPSTPGAPLANSLWAWSAARYKEVSGFNSFRRASTLARAARSAQLSKTDRFGQCRPRRGVIWRDHRIVGRKLPFRAILIRRQAMGPQVPFQ